MSNIVKSNKKNLNVKSTLIVIFGLLAIGLIIYLATTVIPNIFVSLTKASSSDKVVTSNSYLIGERILCDADGEDECIVNAFLLDKEGKGVKGKSIEVTGIEDVSFVNELSDSFGKVSFTLTSTEEKQYRINANYGGQPLPQTIVVTFRN